MPDVALHEPHTALDGGHCGLTAYRAIIASLARLVTPSGAAVLELGAGQYASVDEIAKAAGFRTTARLDLARNTRAIILHTSP